MTEYNNNRKKIFSPAKLRYGTRATNQSINASQNDNLVSMNRLHKHFHIQQETLHSNMK